MEEYVCRNSPNPELSGETWQRLPLQKKMEVLKIIPGGYFSPDFWFTIHRITIHHLCCSIFFGGGRPEGIACTLLVLN